MLLSDGFTSDDVSAQLEAAGGGGGDTNDTGLGSDLECSETRHIVGKADFSEPEGTCMWLVFIIYVSIRFILIL